MNFDAGVRFGVNLVRSLVRKGQRRMDTSPADEHMRGVVQIFRDMDQRLPVCGSLLRLQPGDFKPEI